MTGPKPNLQSTVIIRGEGRGGAWEGCCAKGGGLLSFGSQSGWREKLQPEPEPGWWSIYHAAIAMIHTIQRGAIILPPQLSHGDLMVARMMIAMGFYEHRSRLYSNCLRRPVGTSPITFQNSQSRT